MPRKHHALTALGLRHLREPGLYHDGQGLYLDVVSDTRRTWTFRFMRNRRARTMGLGSASVVSLAEARAAAQAARQLLAKGVDPIEHRRKERAAARPEVTFTAAASAHFTAHSPSWRNLGHRAQWQSPMGAYAEPVIGKVAVGDIDTAHVLRVLQPIWTTKTETAARVRGRIEQVLDFAIAYGWRAGPNPAAWRGNLRSLLPAKAKMHPVQHHAALDWREAPAFVAKLREEVGIGAGAAALLFLILTASRSGETRGARWDEIDLKHAIWTIPGARMKGGRENDRPHHRRCRGSSRTANGVQLVDFRRELTRDFH